MTSYADSSDGVRIAYELDRPATTAVVLVHGWSCDRSYWRHLDAPADGRATVRLDLAGHGDSGRDRQEWTMTRYGDDVIAVVDALPLTEVILVGHSMGGNASLEAARRLGSRVAAIIMVDTYGRLDPPADAPPVEAIVAPFDHDFATTTTAFVQAMFQPGEPPEVADRVTANMASADPTCASSSLRASLTYGRGAARVVDGLDLPVVAINSDYLGADEASLARYGVTVERLPGAGHFPMLTQPERFATVLAAAIDRAAPTPRS